MSDAERARSADGGSTVRVDLHCHSHLSDGYYPPGEVASLLADAGVDYAVLTDHQTVAGTEPFHQAASRLGISEFAGAELHARLDGVEIHLLAYGFEPGHPAMTGLYTTAPDARDAIAAVHAAGGIAVLAHPLSTGWAGEDLERAVGRLAGYGLDGLEAIYKPYTPDERAALTELADRFDLVVSAGSDFHGPVRPDADGPGIDMPVARWKRFRASLSDHARAGRHVRESQAERTGGVDHDEQAPGINWRWLAARIILPSLLVIGFFIVLLFAVLIPSMEERLLERKREMITELTNSAWSILSDYHREVSEGAIDESAAQRAAIERIRRLRYGPDSLDYFWITDMHPRMVMHPYRPDLEGGDLSGFTDPDGVRPFVRFVDAVRRHSAGFVTYVWQWQDDPERLEAKESYVRGFDPWGWIIGTGLYVDDVRIEIRTITGYLVDASFVVTIVAAGLLVMVAWQSLKVERRRSEAERELRRSHERYRALVEASASGALLLIDGRCTYANRTLLELLGYTASELAFLDVHDLVVGAQPEDAGRIDEIARGREIREPFEVTLARKDGAAVPVLLSSSPVFYSGRQAVILTVQNVAAHQALKAELGESRAKYEALTQNISSGVFRAGLGDGMPILEMNPAARSIFGLGEREPPPFQSLVNDPDAYDALVQRLRIDGAVRDLMIQVRRPDGSVALVKLSAAASAGNGEPDTCAAIIDDVSERRRSELERENLISQLQTSLLFLTEPVRNSMEPPLTCGPDASIAQAVRLMSRHDADAVTVTGPGGELLGIVTDHDIRERVVAAGTDTRLPVSRIMTAPVVSIGENAPLFEALLLERERSIDHLVVLDGADRPAGVVRGSRTVRLDRYSLVVLLHQIGRAGSTEELAECRERLPVLIGSLVESGARPENICHVTTAVSDAVASRVIALAIEELGPPPCRFAFLALGSEAREEQTLATDQDNALVYEDLSSDAADAERYFLSLGERVCDALDAIGYRHCRGETMAKNPRWNQPLAKWKAYYDEWVAEPDGQAIAHCNIYFDQRCIFGDCSMVQELWRHVDNAVTARPAFLSHVALHSLQYKPPVGLFGRIVTGSAGEASNTFNIKDAMVPIVNFARLYALRHHVRQTNTLDRLEQLHTLGLLQEESHRGLSQAYAHLMQLRYRHQAALLKAGRDADNSIDPRTLTQLEVGVLKNTFSQISVIQKKVSFDFRGTG